MVVGLVGAQLVDQEQVVVQIVGDVVEEEVLVDRAVGTTLGAGAVVGHSHDDGVVELADHLQEVQEAADLLVGVGREGGVDLGHAHEQRLLVFGQGVPGAHVVGLRPGGTVGDADDVALVAGAVVVDVEHAFVVGVALGRGADLVAEDAQGLHVVEDIDAVLVVAVLEGAGVLEGLRVEGVQTPRPRG